MKNGLLIGALLASVATASLVPSPPSHAAGIGASPVAKVEHCSADVSTYNYRRSDKEFVRIAADLNREFSRNVDMTKSIGVAKERRAIVPEGADTIRIQVDSVTCGAGKRPRNGIASLGGCNYAGCIGNLGPEYANMPPGSTVSISVCSQNVQTVSNYTRQGDGTWLMVGYRQELVASCTLQPLG